MYNLPNNNILNIGKMVIHTKNVRFPNYFLNWMCNKKSIGASVVVSYIKKNKYLTGKIY